MSLIKLEVSRQVLLMLYGAVNREAEAGLGDVGDLSPEQIGTMTRHLERVARTRDELAAVWVQSHGAPFKTYVVKGETT